MTLKSFLKGWIHSPFLLFFLLQGAICRADSVKPFFKTDCFAYSEPISISEALFDNYDGKISKGERQWVWSWIEAGFRWRQSGISIVHRYDYNLRFSPDTAKLYALTANKRNLAPGKEYDIDMKADIFHAKGLRISYNSMFLSNRLTIATGLSYLKSGYFIKGELNGKATILAENDYDYDVQANYQYTEDTLFGRSVDKTTGSGFSLDIDATMRFSEAWSARLQVTDIFGRIYWKNLPFTEAVASSNRKKYDDDGYVHIDPALTGREGEHYRYTQTLSPRGMLEAKYSYLDYHAFAEGYFQNDFFLWAIGHNINAGSGHAIIKYWPANHAVTLGYKYHKFEIDLTTDHFQADKAKTLKLVISYGYEH